MGIFSIETSVSSRDFLCLRLQRLRTSSDTVSRAAEQTEARLPQQNTGNTNNIPSICTSYTHQCTWRATPLSCSYTFGNVQINSRSSKKNCFPSSYNDKIYKFALTCHNVYVQTTGNLNAVRHTLEYLHQETSSLPEEVPKLQRMCCAGKALSPQKAFTMCPPCPHSCPPVTSFHCAGRILTN